MTVLTSWLGAISRMIDAAGNDARPALDDRIAAFDAFELYYHNQIYEALSAGGRREQVNATLGNAAAADLAGLYNPVAEVVDLYQHVFGGAFRRAGDDPGEDQPTDIRAESGSAAMLDALDRVWAWSNLNVTKQQLCRLPALHGTAGLRIVAVNDPDPLRRRVYLKPEHPRVIRDVEVDARGNVQAAELQYDLTRGLGDAQEVVTVREVLTKTEIRTYRVHQGGLTAYDVARGVDGGPGARYENTLGVVPYVLLTHQDGGDAFGLNAFYRARAPIDRLNALLTHINTQIHDHVKVTWAIFASGPAPSSIDLGGRKVVYVDTSRGAQPPSMEPMVAPLNLGDAITQARLLIELIEDRLPELKAVVGRFLAGQSGETIAQLRAPAEQRLGLARAHYEDALVRASQIAASWGVLLGLWDLGTGTGTVEAAERAYQTGLEDFTLSRRPLLPPVTTTTSAQPAARPVVVAPVPAEEV